MKIHPLMLLAAIAFWGWQCAQWLPATAAAALLCASFYTRLRWQQNIATLRRVADFCSVLALLLGGYLYVSYGNPRAIIAFFMWLPYLFLPLALTHAYGAAQRMDLSVLFWSLRRQRYAQPPTFDPWFPYYAVWIIAAAAANGRSEWFYAGLIALVGWPLVRIRPWSYRVGSWGVAFSIAIVLGFGLQYGLHQTQAWLEDAVPDWITASGSRTDPYRANTDIGHIGKLKDSDAIVLRVVPSADAKPPRLLHRASYNTYFGATWLARGVAFQSVPGAANDVWPLAPAAAAVTRATIHDYSARPNPLLSLPAGTTALETLKAITLQRNALGAVQIVREPGYFSYVAAYSGEQAFDGPPTADDTRVPQKERESFEALAVEMGLKQIKPADAVTAVRQFFAHGYRYATFQKNAPLLGSPIVDFLHRSKAGHCEYFATATTLLLRAGGIPARYATGFAVLEKSARENAYLVRTRHAHAWVRAYVNGVWIEIDTTPPSWSEIEAADSGVWSQVTDLWSWLHFRAAQAWAGSDPRKLVIGALLVVFPFGLWLAQRLYRSRRTIKNNEQKQIVIPTSVMGADSEFYRIEHQLTEQGWGRLAHETARDWLMRLQTDAKMDIVALAEIVALHNRYRFDPAGLDATQRVRLKNAAGGWLANNTNAAKT